MDTSPRQPWIRFAKHTARLINCGWWIDLFAPALIILGLTGSVLLLILRSQMATIASLTLGLASITVLLSAALASFFIARKRFISLESALVRLEQHLHLHNALTVALAGIGDWPAIPTNTSHLAGLQFRWGRILTPLLLVTLTILAAILLPISPTGSNTTPENEPLAWAQMDSWIETLRDDDVVEEQSAEEIEAKIEQLRNLDKQDWFSHSSLEATDNLSAQLSNSIRKLGLESATAERSLAMLNALDSTFSESARDRLTQQYQDALKGLSASQLPLNSKLLKQLENLDPSQLTTLNPAQLKQLRAQLNQASASSQKCLGMTPGELTSSLQAELDVLLFIPGQGLGRGGITRGPGTAPVTLSNQPDDLHTNNLETVATGDFSRATLGDMLGLADGEHDIDTTSTGPTRAGKVGATGKGGALIWRDSLVPKEKEILKNYFE